MSDIIRPSIYIGLGGTGILAIAQAKKMFEDAYGKGHIPSQIAFIAIDFNLQKDAHPGLATSIDDDFLSLTDIGNPLTLYDAQSENGAYRWMFRQNVRMLPSRVAEGASQVRTSGRFLTEMIIQQINHRIQTCITQVTNIQGNTNESTSQNQPVIHIAMSLAGGTGGGSFLNIAQAIRDQQQEVTIIGYGVLHGVFRTMDVTGRKTPRVVVNSYSAVMDLDFLMRASIPNPINVTMNGGERSIKRPPFDDFYIVDNNTDTDKRIDNVQKLCEVVGTYLYVAAGNIGSQISSQQSNVSWKVGTFNITPKLGWVSALGACQVVYKGNLLAEIYSHKAAVEVINQLLSSDPDISKMAMDWTEESHTREDGEEWNMLIDSIFSPAQINSLKKPNCDVKDTIPEVKDTISRYLTNLQDFPDRKVVTKMTDQLIEALTKKINKILNAENGVGTSLVFVNELRHYYLKYKSEMNSEGSQFDKKYEEESRTIKGKINDYEAYKKRLFKPNLDEELDLIEKPSQCALQFEIESARRKIAFDIYSSLIAKLYQIEAHVKDLNDKLIIIKKEYEDKLAELQTCTESSLVFEYDLSSQERLSMNIGNSDILVSDYISQFCPSLYDVALPQIGETILSYTKQLPKANEYRDKLIVDVIASLNDNDYKHLVEEITAKSCRLLQVNDRGQVKKVDNSTPGPSNLLVKNLFISYYPNQSNKFRLETDKDTTFIKDVPKQFIPSTVAAMKQKIIFCRSDMSIIPYCIGAFDESAVSEYNSQIQDAMMSDSTEFNPHFDQQIFNEMQSLDFKLKPELKNEALFYWIAGLIFGFGDKNKDENANGDDALFKESYHLSNGEEKQEVEVVRNHDKYIRCYKKKYQYYDQNGESKGVDGHWRTINTDKRSTAFATFKTILPSLKVQYSGEITNKLTNNGAGFYHDLIDNIIKRGKDQYVDALVCGTQSSATVFKSQTEESIQYDKEWNYIETGDFEKTLKNLNK